jgi:hypothetical protein
MKPDRPGRMGFSVHPMQANVDLQPFAASCLQV